ncbi:exodeoxyribonuclease V subunit gamma [Lonepinella sp. BR2357]|uniref:exodeoxyribonuclease V subunit gamma n=1 Tax=Lonepinella sp. BR2357 TaxID=3434549 RepID=UPI003F6E35E0
MFKIYHSNDLDVQKDILCELIKRDPLDDPFETETILVQSPGMAQWLQLQLAEKQGIAANFKFPMPASFIWQQYVDNLPNVLPNAVEQSQFSKEAMTWRLMGLIKQLDFQPILHYLHYSIDSEQHKLYQLASKIADLFDQYLVYRPQWITAWEQQQPEIIVQEILSQQKQLDECFKQQIMQDVAWQGKLWCALIGEVASEGHLVQHRANLYRQYLQLSSYKNLPKRLFIFGISALPKTYLDTLAVMAEHCDVHLFFNNPSQYYWGDIVDPTFAQKRALKTLTKQQSGQAISLFNDTQLEDYFANKQELTAEDEHLSIGHPLLATWGKLGRDFFYLLSRLDSQEIQANTELTGDSHLLTQVKRKILQLAPSQGKSLHWTAQDPSLSFHACHSPMREVEVLHDYLLQCFQQDEDLTPKDIVVMVANIDRYAPYIQAVFGQYQVKIQDAKGKWGEDKRYIPFSIADQTLSESDVLLATFLHLLRLKDSQFSAEDVLALLDIPAIRQRFSITLGDLDNLRHWVKDSGIRFGLEKSSTQGVNFNAWQAGLERMLLGFALREENGIWQQENLGFDNSYGLNSRLVGALARFIEQLHSWQITLSQPHTVTQWETALTALLADFFSEEAHTVDMLRYIENSIQQVSQSLKAWQVDEPLTTEVMVDVLTEKLNAPENSLKFLVGKVSFCTLLPMRTIPFKVVCLLGMNEQDYPRHTTPNSFDLMQYHRQKGDRFRRDDDRYLFLEALLSAQQRLYISYVGQSIIDNCPLEPSVLVNQLLDYLYDNLDVDCQPQGDKKALVQYHAMTAWSAKNFSETHRTFAKQWANIANAHQPPLDFVQAASSSTEVAVTPVSIDCEQLIKFVKNPVQFFFEQRLGVYYRDQDEQISDTEYFTLDGLDTYQIQQDLLMNEDLDIEQYFAKLTVKGRLPRGEFAQIYQQQLRSDVEQFRTVIAAYQGKPMESRYIDFTFNIKGQLVQLSGYIDRLFSTENGLQRIQWQAGKHKDSYTIENWLNWLILQVCSGDESVLPAIFYGKDKKNLVGKTFLTEHEFDPEALLQSYIADYLAGEQQVVLTVSDGISGYLKKETDSAKCQFIQTMAEGDKYKAGDIYWQRILKQTADLNKYLEKISENTEKWFRDMLDSTKSL